MSILIDTNVLLRRTQPDHPNFTAAAQSVARVLAAGETAFYTLQNIAEFWNVATRPLDKNGLGFSVDTALKEVEKLEAVLTLLPEAGELYAVWKGLVVTHRVLGSKVHDARLVAAMSVNGVERILTFNTDDFVRYKIEAVHPQSLLA